MTDTLGVLIPHGADLVAGLDGVGGVVMRGGVTARHRRALRKTRPTQ